MFGICRFGLICCCSAELVVMCCVSCVEFAWHALYPLVVMSLIISVCFGMMVVCRFVHCIA